MDMVVVTGGCGFIGGNFIRHLLAHEPGVRVINFDCLSYAGNLASLEDVAGDPRYRFVRGDITDAAAVRALLRGGAHSVIHFAAESHVDRSILDASPFVRTNVLGTQVLLDAARACGVQRYVQVSTDEVYGSLGATGFFTETTSYDPSSPYSASKAGSDHLVRAWGRTYGMPVSITNCSNNYGPYHFPEKLIPLVITNALDGKNLPVYGKGLNVRDWLYVEDHARAIDRVVRAGVPGETYNVGGHNEHTNIDIVQRICDLLDELKPDPAGSYRRLITFVQDRPGHDLRYAIDAGRIERELGWKPEETFATGLRKTVQWYLANRAWVQGIRSGSYRGERLGLG